MLKRFFVQLYSLFLLTAALSWTNIATAEGTEAASTTGASPAVEALVVTDTLVGAGEEALGGSTVQVHYTGWLLDRERPNLHGRKFDSSQGKQPISFVLGTGHVIKGWDQGLAGMRVGGKRTLVIPAVLAYGKRGAGSSIPPDAPLIFDVELVSSK